MTTPTTKMPNHTRRVVGVVTIGDRIGAAFSLRYLA